LFRPSGPQSDEDNPTGFHTTVTYDDPVEKAFQSIYIVNLNSYAPFTLSLDAERALSVNSLDVGFRGTLAMYGGAITAGGEEIRSGYFLQTGGTNSVIRSLLVHEEGAKYELRGGDLSVGSSLGVDGAIFIQAGGYASADVLNILGLGTYSMSGGSLAANREVVGESSGGLFNHTVGNNTVQDLVIGQQGFGLYELTSGTLDVTSNLTIGDGNVGRLNQFGGTSNAGIVKIGNTYGSDGTYDFRGGTLDAGTVYVGYNGAGTFTQIGGIARIDDLRLGELSAVGASSSYRLEGTGSLASLARLVSGVEYIGLSGTGIFDHYGFLDSIHTVGKLNLGFFAGGDGSYNMHGKVLLEAGDEVIGRAGHGSFIQRDGTNIVGAVTIKGASTGTGTLTIGELVGGSGEYSMNPTVGTPELRASTEVIGNYGTGTFTQFGGTNNIAGDLYLGRYAGGSGNYTLNGASSISAVNEYIGDVGRGTFIHNGGSNTLTGDLYLGRSEGGIGSYTLSGSGNFLSPTTLTAINEYVGVGGAGTFTHSGGYNNLSGVLTVGANGTYNLSGVDAGLSPIGGIINHGTFNYSAGYLNIPVSSQTASNFTNNGTLNIIDGTGGRSFSAPVINNGTVNATGTTVTFYGAFTNGIGGSVKTTNATVTFSGDFINNGAYNSDPSTNIFHNLTVEATGFLAGALGDVFRINGDLIVRSLREDQWNTSLATLEFSSGIHSLDFTGSTIDFRFGTLQIDAGVNFSDGSNGTISADVLNIYDFSSLLTGFIGNGIHIHYGSLFAFDSNGIQFDVTEAELTRFASLGFIQASGTQAPVPEPSTLLLLASGLGGLCGFRKYGRRRPAPKDASLPPIS
jgi:hypothetical protein